MAEPILPVAIIVVGGYLSWFAIHYWKSDVTWPSTPIKSLLTQGTITPVSTTAETTRETNLTDFVSGTPATTPATSTPTPTAGTSSATNQATGKLIAAKYGWNTGNEWQDLVLLWNKESNWDNTAQNPTSTAYGIAQFLDETWGTYGTGPKTSDPTLQITYGLMYIKGKYGDPIAAWQHEQAFNWY